MHRQTGAASAYRAYDSGGARALIDKIDDSPLMQAMTGFGMKGEAFSASTTNPNNKGPEAPQNYGFTSVVAAASKGANGMIKQCAEGFMSFIGGNRSFPVAGIMDDRRHRLKNLIKDAAEGSVAMHGLKEWGQQFLITDNGMFMTGNMGKSQKKGGGGGAGQQAAAGGGGGGGQEGENFKIRFQLVENQNGKQQTQQGGGAPKLARSFISPHSGVEFEIETHEFVEALAGEGGGNGASGGGGGETQSKPTGQKTLHKEKSDTFNEMTAEHQHMKRGEGQVKIKDKDILTYYKDEKISTRVTDKHVHIKFAKGDNNTIFVDEQGCWSTKPINIKQDEDASVAQGAEAPLATSGSGTLRYDKDRVLRDENGDLVPAMEQGAAIVAADAPVVYSEVNTVYLQHINPLYTTSDGYLGLAVADPIYVNEDGALTADISGGSGGGAPVGAEYITSTSNATLTAERVLTDTATVTWDRTTAGQIKANAVGGGGISEAPSDSKSYGRMNTAWTRVLAITNDIVDGGNF